MVCVRRVKKQGKVYTCWHNKWYNKQIIISSPPPNSRACSGTVSLAIVHRQADKHCSLTRELKVPPIHFVAEGHLTTQRPRKL